MASATAPGNPPGAGSGGPCAPARLEVDRRCAEAERLAQAAVAHQQRLRDLRTQLQEVAVQREADGRVRDRRQVAEAKDAARQTYRQAMVVAVDRTQVQEAARVWLKEIDRLNRQVALADRRADEVARQATELERALPGVELAADAARISAEAAGAACLEARRALAACEEDAQRRLGTPSGAHAATATPGAPEDSAALPRGPSARPITLVLRGDRATLLSLALRLAEETGVEAGRLQLLLLELREAIAVRALELHALRFPERHPFWGQFPVETGRRIADSLAVMGYRFDGRGGWTDDRAPAIRELAIALSHVGLDPLTLRRPSSPEAIKDLWQGTTVLVEEYLAGCAPDLDLGRVMSCLGPRAARLSELWDMWGRLRPLLLAPPSA